MKREDLIRALAAARDGISGKPVYSESEAERIVSEMSDEYVRHLEETYRDAEEWVDYYTM